MYRSFNSLPSIWCVAFASILAASCGGGDKVLDVRPFAAGDFRGSTAGPDVVIGGQPSEESLDVMAAHGFDTIVTVRAEGEIAWDERAVVEASGLRFVRVPIPNPVHEITDEQVSALADVLADGPGRVLLHCGSGNRAAALWAVWLVEYQGVDAEEAIEAARRAGMRTSMQQVVEKRLAGTDTNGGS